MTTLTDDTRRGPHLSRGFGAGLAFAVVSAVSFGLSGSLARPLLDTGWSPGAVVLARIAIAALVLAPLTVASLRGRWRHLRAQAGQVLLYGAFAVAGAQFGYFSAVGYMDVAPALLIEYTAPAAVVVWMWARHGQRPRGLTVVGALLAATGLVLVLNLITGAHLAWAGVAWSLFAMIGATVYFVISADTSGELPPLALAGSGLAVGALTLGALGLVGVLPMRANTSSAVYAVATVDWWVPLILLGVVTAALAYATGIAAGRRLGSRVASFVALTEVVAAVLFAWLLVDQQPGPAQLAGGLLVIAGIVVVKLADPAVDGPAAEPLP